MYKENDGVWCTSEIGNWRSAIRMRTAKDKTMDSVDTLYLIMLFTAINL